jgi:hypothetical protein
MPPRRRAEPVARATAPTADRATRKGRLTFQAAQVWEECDRRPDPAHRTPSFAKRVIEIQVPNVGAPPRLRDSRRRIPISGIPSSAKSATSRSRFRTSRSSGGRFSRVHGTKGMQAAFATRQTLWSAQCPMECSAAPPADDPSRRPPPGKATVNGITATTSAPKPKRSNLHRSSRA